MMMARRDLKKLYLWLYWFILWVDWYGDTCIELEVEEANNEREK